ncbi:SusC/RagA family TonB-linked outer membrane protein [Niabella ginsengisoli]|uniref:SusC/RagA family TonB-linked outer membrane protein n=1 Tax=Niabella ginsengisoli TaxID=522298 RepID=A0ABS9SJ49_9BACT|nr:SusC/RagA family TonB-linked outer membrane protein [Niabella ginsengisoli]MCH5598389.1 SusC/RagA family TonB-linked outer membrane protein [Niabella ginsengisoli]
MFRKVNETTDYNAFNLFANYDKKIKRHELSLMGGLNIEESLYEQERMERDGVISADYPSISQATGVPVALDNYSDYAVLGVFGRANYSFSGKYLLGLTGRYDASSRFPEGHRSGLFPSVSAGWVLTREKFLSRLPVWMNEIKLRASYGAVGNQAIPEYAFYPAMDAVYADWLVGGAQVTTLTPPGLVSSNFTWATVQTLDFGIDLGLFKNRLTASVDWYQRDTKDMLYEGVQLPAILGTGAPLQNVAALQTKGFEVELSWRDKIGALGYRVGVNLFDSRGRIKSIKNEAGLLSQYYVDQELGEIWGFTTDRLYTVDDFVEGSLSDNLTGGQLKEGIPRREGQLPNPGDILFMDYDGNGIVNAGNNTLSDPGDRRVIGNSTPRYRYNVNAGFNFKGFDLSFVINGVVKAQQWRANQLTFPNLYNFGALYSDQLNYWMPGNETAFHARIYDQSAGNQSFNQSVQTRYLQNGAFLRMKNVTLAYSLPDALIRKIALERVQTFISIENAFTLDRLPSGLDPEINRSGDQGFGYPFLRLYSIGFNVSF